MNKEQLKKHKFDTKDYVILNDGLMRIDKNKIAKALKTDANLYLKELKDALKKQKWLEVIHAAIELQAIDDAKFYLFTKDWNL